MIDKTGQSDVDYYYIHDHLFSPMALLESNGDVAERYEYDAYGEPRFYDADFVLLATQASAYNNPIMFTGQRLDRLDSGDLLLMNYKGRVYDPATGRFLQHDPIGYGDGMNLYQYVRSRPIVAVDLLGLFGGNAFDSYQTPYSLADRLLTTYFSRMSPLGGVLQLRKGSEANPYTFDDELNEMMDNVKIKMGVCAYYRSLVMAAKNSTTMNLYCKPWKTIPVTFGTDNYKLVSKAWDADDQSFLGGFLLNGCHSVWARGQFKTFCKKFKHEDVCWIKEVQVDWRWRDALDGKSFEDFGDDIWGGGPLLDVYHAFEAGILDSVLDKVFGVGYSFDIEWKHERGGAKRIIVIPLRP